MFDKIQRWFAGIGAAIAKPDKPPPADPPPDMEVQSVAETAKQVAPPRPVPMDVAPPARAPAVAPAPHRARAAIAAEDHDVEETIDDDGTRAHEHLRGQDDAGAPSGAQPGATDLAAPEQEEIKRRRELVRSLFNDFWSGRDDKPAAFVDRLDEAETYLNERLSASGEVWRLDAASRKLLGLPPRHAPGESSAPQRA